MATTRTDFERIAKKSIEHLVSLGLMENDAQKIQIANDILADILFANIRNSFEVDLSAASSANLESKPT
jgi:hypothetical protein